MHSTSSPDAACAALAPTARRPGEHDRERAREADDGRRDACQHGLRHAGPAHAALPPGNRHGRHGSRRQARRPATRPRFLTRDVAGPPRRAPHPRRPPAAAVRLTRYVAARRGRPPRPCRCAPRYPAATLAGTARRPRPARRRARATSRRRTLPDGVRGIASVGTTAASRLCGATRSATQPISASRIQRRAAGTTTATGASPVRGVGAAARRRRRATSGWAAQQRLELGRRDLQRVDLDQLLEAVDDVHLAAASTKPEVARAQPAARGRRARRSPRAGRGSPA